MLLVIVALVTIVLSLLALGLDNSVRDWFRAPGFTGKPRTQMLRPILENAVEVQLYIAVPAILLSFANRRKLIVGWITALVLSIVLTHTTKILVGRARPHMNLEPAAAAPLSMDAKQQSFPSGHTSAAVANAALLGMYFPRGRVVFWILAAALGAERIRVEAHFLSDVVAGAGIGIVAVLLARVLIRRADFFRPRWNATADEGPHESR